jgi:hypothetical protein
MNRIAGLLLIGFTSLTTAIVIALAALTRRVDEIDGTYAYGWFVQLPLWVFLFLLIPFVIGLVLWDKKDSDK